MPGEVTSRCTSERGDECFTPASITASVARLLHFIELRMGWLTLLLWVFLVFVEVTTFSIHFDPFRRSIRNQISDVFSKGHNPIAHARRARCLAHVGPSSMSFVRCQVSDSVASMRRVQCVVVSNPRAAACVRGIVSHSYNPIG